MKALHLCDNEELCWVNEDIERYPLIASDIKNKGFCKAFEEEVYLEVFE